MRVWHGFGRRPTVCAGTQNTLGHTVASLGIRPPGYATGGLNDGFANPAHTVSAGNNMRLRSQLWRGGRGMGSEGPHGARRLRKRGGRVGEGRARCARPRTRRTHTPAAPTSHLAVFLYYPAVISNFGGLSMVRLTRHYPAAFMTAAVCLGGKSLEYYLEEYSLLNHGCEKSLKISGSFGPASAAVWPRRQKVCRCSSFVMPGIMVFFPSPRACILRISPYTFSKASTTEGSKALPFSPFMYSRAFWGSHFGL